MNNWLFAYQSLPSKISPEIFTIGGFGLRWYSLGYVVAFITTVLLIKYRIRKKELSFNINYDDIDQLSVYVMLGIVFGGRLGYVLFYDLAYYINHPLEVILPFRFDNGFRFVGISGISYHGGLLALIGVNYFYAKNKGYSFIKLIDLYASTASIAYTFGRLGNFMNGELYGRETTVAWGMYFLDNNKIPFETLRHPSQLYEAFGEGILLFLIVWFLRKKVAVGVLSGIYMFGYGFVRFIIEFFRQPDAIFKNPGDDLGSVLWFLTMGQVLCMLMMFSGLVIIYYFYKADKKSLKT